MAEQNLNDVPQPSRAAPFIFVKLLTTHGSAGIITTSALQGWYQLVAWSKRLSAPAARAWPPPSPRFPCPSVFLCPDSLSLFRRVKGER